MLAAIGPSLLRYAFTYVVEDDVHFVGSLPAWVQRTQALHPVQDLVTNRIHAPAPHWTWIDDEKERQPYALREDVPRLAESVLCSLRDDDSVPNPSLDLDHLKACGSPTHP